MILKLLEWFNLFDENKTESPVDENGTSEQLTVLEDYDDTDDGKA